MFSKWAWEGSEGDEGFLPAGADRTKPECASERITTQGDFSGCPRGHMSPVRPLTQTIRTLREPYGSQERGYRYNPDDCTDRPDRVHKKRIENSRHCFRLN